MPATKRAPIYLDPALHDALQQKAAAAQTSISDIVNEVVRQSLADYEEEAEDLADLERRRAEPNVPIENVVLRSALDNDEADHAIFEKRRNGPTVGFETFAADMKRRGLV